MTFKKWLCKLKTMTKNDEKCHLKNVKHVLLYNFLNDENRTQIVLPDYCSLLNTKFRIGKELYLFARLKWIWSDNHITYYLAYYVAYWFFVMWQNKLPIKVWVWIMSKTTSNWWKMSNTTSCGIVYHQLWFWYCS